MATRKRRSLIISAPSSPTIPEESRFFSSAPPTTSLGLGLNNSNGTGQQSRHSFFRINSGDDRNISFDSLTDSSNIKLLLIGDAGVGKTAMILSYCNELSRVSTHALKNNVDRTTENRNATKSELNRVKNIAKRKRYSLNDFENSHTTDDSDFEINTTSTIGIDIKTNLVNIDNRFFRVIMWDTAGQERYRNAMISSLYKGSNGVILSYDICDFNSFLNCLNFWLVESIENISDLSKTRFYLVGNKLDLYKERNVTHEDVLNFISRIEKDYNINICGNFEVSCKWENVVERTFNIIIKDLVESGCYEDDRELRVIPSNQSEESESSMENIPGPPKNVRQRLIENKSKTVDLTKPLHDGNVNNPTPEYNNTCCT
ncbi:unnamed protein product [Kluyveromyces dobzhanskii CBS 2104]|uniref:WGS project CCBQ000000000 data, contig 00015 n=1 Tax=Kluyveromyces dobzhanskii CBS 2104 TaxID=1427455 RepID=A0A0A8LB51_9SACH|nr:unnamed protein product [Kluyveromyces dobzhanskii CBS 2104]